VHISVVPSSDPEGKLIFSRVIEVIASFFAD